MKKKINGAIQVKSMSKEDVLSKLYLNAPTNSTQYFQNDIDPTVAACIRILSETVGKLSAYLYKRSDKGDERIQSHPYTKVLTRRPNDFQSMQTFLEMIVQHLCLNGNFYAVIMRNGKKIIGFLPIENPNAVQPELINGQLIYRVSPDIRMGIQYKPHYPKDEILHIRCAAGTLLKGVGPYKLAEQAIILSQLQRQHSLNFTAKASIPSALIALKNDGVRIEDEVIDEVVTALESAFSGGSNNSGQLAVVPSSVEYHQLTVSNVESQFLESQMKGIKEICAVFGVPPHMITGSDQKYSNFGQSLLAFYTETIAPYIARIQEAFNEHIEDDGIMFALDESELKRGDTAQMITNTIALFNAGIITQNEARAEISKAKDPEGDRYYVQTNNVDIGTLKELMALQVLEKSTSPTATSTTTTPENNNKNEGINNEEANGKLPIQD